MGGIFNFMEKIKNLLKSPNIIVLFFALKMMVYYYLIEVNRMELLLILLSIGVWSVIFVCFARCGLKRKKGIFLVIYSLLSLLMFSDTMYFNYYNQTVSIRQLWQAASVTAVPKSFIATLIPASFLLFVDIPFVYHYFKKDIAKVNQHSWSLKREIKYVVYGLTAFVITIIANPFHSAAIERVNSMEFFTNHVNDICETIANNIAPEEMEEDEILDVVSEVAEENEEPVISRFKGIGEGKNLVVIQLEAFQDFVLNKEYNGQEITPNLNQLLKENTIYFDQYYSNIGKGNTSDAEFSTLNSLYPIIDGESYRLYEQNTYNGLPWAMRDHGYYSFAVHGFEGQFWNRENAYPYQGFQDFISMEDLNQDEIIGLGVSDKSMFHQLVPILKEKQSPFFSFVITLTNHHPFVLDEQYRSLLLTEEDKDTKFGAYLETVRYTDEALGQFIADLKAAGLYENTVIALYGDHHGLNCGMEDVYGRVSEFIGRSYDYDEMLNVPLIIHVPESDVNETIHTTGGQIDFFPTIANVMGLSLGDQTFILGQDLANAKEGFVAFTSYLFEGSFAKDNAMFEISRGGIFEGSRAWEIGTGTVLDASLYKAEYDKAILLKKTSEEILQQNLIANYITHENETEQTIP
jgi:phosphoglycerol transferase MdoB-like AlkP superfamily enzyme